MVEREQFIQALDELSRALDENLKRIGQMQQRIADLQRVCREGMPVREVVRAETPPLIVNLLTESGNVLHAYGARVRRAEARALHREGLTMEEIATLFGVTRQRVSALLREESRRANG